jgi:hypothetical protein
MKLLRLLLTILAVTTLATACGTSPITAPEIPPHQQNQMGSGNG